MLLGFFSPPSVSIVILQKGFIEFCTFIYYIHIIIYFSFILAVTILYYLIIITVSNNLYYHLNDKQFPCGLCSDDVEDYDHSVQCDLVTSGITLDVLILVLNNMKNLKKTHYPGSVHTVQWKYLSQHSLIKA